ncbi:MAG: hypothetical protein U0228_22570 [Myxococcaceae bacterium]
MTQPHDTAVKAFRDATATPPPFAKERVWTALNEPPRRSRSALVPALALVASVTVGAIATQAYRATRTTSEQWSDDQSAIAWVDAKATRHERSVVLERGELAVSSWGAPIEVRAGGHVFQVEGGVAVIRVAADSATAEVIEGAVLVDGKAELARPGTAPSPLVAAVESLESKPARSRRLLRRAELALSENRVTAAVEDLGEVASSGTLDAEVANFRRAELQLRRLDDAAGAVQTLEDGERLFAHGALSQERELTQLEALAKLERWVRVVAVCDAFLERHPGSERAKEVRALRAMAVERGP